MYPTKLSYLTNRAEELGNHYQKYVHLIQNIYPSLSASFSKINHNPDNDFVFSHQNHFKTMKKISTLDADSPVILEYLGCYYAIQFLWFNLTMLDWLEFRLKRSKNHQRIYQSFILNTGLKFRRLTAAYMHHLFEHFSNGKPVIPFVITGVGTRSDQDDIDVGIIDAGVGDRQTLNKIIGKINLQMTRYASNFHFHLSEHVGEEAYSASIQEYDQLLKIEIGNFVILTEMLSAARIIGSQALFEEFQDKIISRYYYDGKPNRYHEGYLRGILGEIIDLSSIPLDPSYIHPKHDGLRISKNLIYAYKTRYGIKEVNPWRILKKLKHIEPDLKKEFHTLQHSLTFLEIFRYLYQQFVVQEEYVLVSDSIMFNKLQQVASCLLYEDYGPHSASFQLFQDYRNAVRNLNDVLPVFIKDLTNHLQKHSVFNKLIFQENSTKHILKSLFRQLNFFRLTHFWDDLFLLIEDNSTHISQRILKEVTSLNPEDQKKIFIKLADWAQDQPEFIFKFCSAINIQFLIKERQVLNQFLSVYLSRHKDKADFLLKLITLFHKDPQLICKSFQSCNADNLEELKEIVFRKTLNEPWKSYQKNLAELLNLISSCSYYFKRVITNIYDQLTEYSCYIRHPELLEKICDKFLVQLSFTSDIDERKNILGTYYDLKFLQIGLETFQGSTVQRINEQFTHFVINYMQELFRLCFNEINQKSAAKSPSSNTLLIYASGGNGREQAFDDDFDIIVLSDAANETERLLHREVLALMNTEMIKRGTLPHFRFSEHFGEYICPFNDLKELIRSKYPDCFIDKSQLLEARLVIGSSALHNKFIKEIIEDSILVNSRLYVEQMIEEIHRRHKSTVFFNQKCANIKECTGGLRDIEMIILIYKVIYGLLETNPYKLITEFCTKSSDFSEEWKQIKSSLQFLQHFRYLYRLSIAAEDEIYPESLGIIASKFNPYVESREEGACWLWKEFISHRKKAWYAMQNLIRPLP